MLTKFTPCIDIDLLNEDAAKAVEELARERFEERGYFLVRVGKAPKRAILFRTNDPFPKCSLALVAPNGDTTQKIEVLADGQQVVVAGVHPETHKDYVWHGGTLTEIPRGELPYISAEEAQQFLKDATALLIAEHGYTERETANATGEAGDRPRADWSRLTANILAGVELHDSLRDLAASSLASGMTDEAACRLLEALMLQTPRALRDDRWTERLREIPRAVRSAREKFGTPQEASSFGFCNIAAWAETEPPEREWAVPDRFPLRNVSMLSGEGAAGKSILFMQLAAALKLEKGWLNTLPEPGPVIYLNAEDEEAEMHRRMLAIAQHHHASLKDLVGHLNILSLIGQDTVLSSANRARLDSAHTAVRKAQGRGLRHSPSRDRPRHFGRHFRRQRDRPLTGAAIHRTVAADRDIAGDSAVIILTHPSLTGIKEGTGLSGSTAWHNSVRARAYLTSIKSDDGSKSDLRRIEFRKNDYGPLAESLTLRWDNGVYVPQGGPGTFERAAAEANAENLFLKLLARFNAQSRNANDKTGPTYAPALFSGRTGGQNSSHQGTCPRRCHAPPVRRRLHPPRTLRQGLAAPAAGVGPHPARENAAG